MSSAVSILPRSAGPVGLHGLVRGLKAEDGARDLVPDGRSWRLQRRTLGLALSWDGPGTDGAEAFEFAFDTDAPFGSMYLRIAGMLSDQDLEDVLSVLKACVIATDGDLYPALPPAFGELPEVVRARDVDAFLDRLRKTWRALV
jgi:hypothetical protein